MVRRSEEMEQMGWIGPKRPRMVTVQASGCAPIVQAFEAGKRFADEFAERRDSGVGTARAEGYWRLFDSGRDTRIREPRWQ